MLPLGDIIRERNVCFHSDVDDKQLYISAEPNDAAPVNSIFTCLLAINKWISKNLTQKLNKDKPENLVIGSKSIREMLLN